MDNIKISLNLLHYFNDHRQLTRIFINDNMQTINDLKKHIIKMFNIDKHFYLTCHNVYLPSSEDIRILYDGEVINVLPASRRKSQLDKQYSADDEEQVIEDAPIENKTKTKKKRKPLINEDKTDVETTKKKDKSRRKSQYGADDEEQVFQEEPIENKTKTKKKRKCESIINEEVNCGKVDVETSDKKKKRNKKNAIIEEVLLETKASYPEKNKRKRQEIESMDTEPNQNTNNESSSLRKSSQWDSKLAEVSNKKIATKVIIHSVEVFKKPEEINQSFEAEKSVSILDRINLFERLSPQNKSGNTNTSKRSVNKEDYGSSDINNAQTSATNKMDAVRDKSVKYKNKHLFSVGSTMDLLTNNADTLSNSIDYENIDDASVTKRRRVRTRKRKRLNAAVEPERVEHVTFRPPKSRAAPIQHIKFNNENEQNTSPEIDSENNDSINNDNRIHIAHNSETYTNENNVTNNVSTPTELNVLENDPKLKLFHSTPYVGDDSLLNSSQSYTDSEANTTANDSNRNSMKFDPMDYPLLTDTPVTDNLIFFKKLKISENYTPQVSNYILAQVKDVSTDGNKVTVQILEGHEEFREPKGKFSCIPEEEEDDKEEEESLETTKMAPICIDRASLIEPRIMQLASANL